MNIRNPSTANIRPSASVWFAFFKRFLTLGFAALLLAAPVLAARADGASADFLVSVQVVRTCHLNLPDTSLPAGEFTLSCSRGTGYQVRVDGQPAAAGTGNGAAHVLSLAAAAKNSPPQASARQPHWLTILY